MWCVRAGWDKNKRGQNQHNQEAQSPPPVSPLKSCSIVCFVGRQHAGRLGIYMHWKARWDGIDTVFILEQVRYWTQGGEKQRRLSVPSGNVSHRRPIEWRSLPVSDHIGERAGPTKDKNSQWPLQTYFAKAMRALMGE